MRPLFLTLLALALAARCAAQEEAVEPVETAAAEKGSGLREGHAERQQAMTFRMFPSEETARDYYYGLLDRGYDLEAARFKERNREYTFALTPYRRGFECIYAEAGFRSSGNSGAGSIYNGTYGGFFRVSGTVRLWHSVSYLQQDDNLGHYKQGEYFSAMYTYLGRGWYLNPSLHYIYAGFTDVQRERYPVTYTDSVPGRRNNYIVYHTSAVQSIAYTSVGQSHYAHLGVPVARRLGRWMLEAQPSLQYIHSRAARSYEYANAGTMDSSVHNRYLGTAPYAETGSGNLADTTTDVFIAQLGGSVSYRFQAFGMPVLVRGGGWYLRSNGASAAAYQAYVLVEPSPKLWVHGSFLGKGRLPFALESEGIYLNMYHAVRARAGLTLQAFPLRRWSPMVTYQYERQHRYADDALLIYHALYFTLKYRL